MFLVRYFLCLNRCLRLLLLLVRLLLPGFGLSCVGGLMPGSCVVGREGPISARKCSGKMVIVVAGMHRQRDWMCTWHAVRAREMFGCMIIELGE